MNNELRQEFSLWETIKKDWYLFVLMLAPLALALYFYPQLPDRVPSHWDIRGNIDGYSGKAFAVWFFPLLNIAVYFLMVLAPRLDPRRENYQRFGGAYRIIRSVTNILLAGIYLLTILVALGYDIKVDFIIKLSISVLFLIIGNVMGKFRHNYFVGIKSPWTLASEEVWHKTHRFSARLWVGCSLACIILSLLDTLWANYLFFAIVMIMALLPMVVSYLYYRQLSK